MRLITGRQIKKEAKLKEVCVWFNVCPLKRFYEEGKLNIQWLKDYCWGNFSICIRKKLEDKGLFHPDNMLPDGTIDEDLK